jgi:hypothetical protein
MIVWSVADLMEFARALRLAGDCFVARRIMQRVDDESLTVVEATAVLRNYLGGQLRLRLQSVDETAEGGA